MKRLDRLLVVVCMICRLVQQGRAAEAPVPAARPVLQVKSDGPTAAVTALAFSADGRTLYAAGFDKVVRSWIREAAGFRPGPVYRVPVGPGSDGALNALAVSADGRWLATAGKGVVREAMSFRDIGHVEPSDGRLSAPMQEDLGVIYLFELTGQRVQALRGHRGPVLALAFAPAAAGKPPLLVSVAREENRGTVRLWNAETGMPLAQAGGLADPRESRPGLAVWHAGPDVRAVRAAIAVRDGPLQLWQVERDTLAAVERAGNGTNFNDTAAFLQAAGADGGKFLTADFHDGSTRLRGWRAGHDLAPDDEHSGLIAERCAPRALALWPGVAALVVRYPDKSQDPNKERNHLQLFRLDAGPRFGQRQADIPLWSGGRLPVLAATADGTTLAVGGNAGHEIWIFTARELAKQGEPRQILAGDGMNVGRVAFVRKGDSRGLRLREKDGQVAFDFDLTHRRLQDSRSSWKEDGPRLNGWTVASAGKRQPPLFTVRRNGTVVGRVRLQAGQRPTAHSVLPGARPLLAVGYEELGVTYLTLYDVKSGAEIRQLTGHLNPIQSLAFAADGRLLASAASDRTVSVWSLVDLDEVRSQHGRLRGLALGKDGDRLTIARIVPDELSPANRAELVDRLGVQPGDVVEGVVHNDTVERPAAPHDFYEALWRHAPGRRVTLRLPGRGDATVTLDQGVDAHNPLFSLFLTGSGEASQRRWIGWSPAGPYDASDHDQTERSIGWHRNEPRPGAFVSFSAAQDYRKEYRHDGLLRHLVEQGALTPALEKWRQAPPEHEPDLSLGIDQLGPDLDTSDGQGRPIVRDGRLTLRATVRDIAPAKIDRVRWRFDDGVDEPFTGVSEREYTADLSRLPWRRGVHTLTLAVTPFEASARERTATFRLRYVPPRPVIVLDPDWLKKLYGDRAANPASLPAPVRRPTVTLDATVQPGSAAPDAPQILVSVRNLTTGKEKKVAGLKIQTDTELQPGVNELEIVAWNDGREAELSAYETTSQRILIQCLYERIVPPQITLESVTPRGQSALPPAGSKFIVHTPKVTVRGCVTAEEPLTAVELAGKALAGFDPKHGLKSFPFATEVDLKPGESEWVFAARTKRAAGEPKRLKLEYRPGLPRFEMTDPPAPEDLSAGARNVTLTGLLHPTLDTVLDGVALTVNRQPVATEFQAGAGTLTAPLALHPGENSVIVTLRNGFDRRAYPYRFYVRRPPQVRRPASPIESKEPRIDVSFEVETPADLPLSAAGLNDLTATSVRETGKPAEDVRTWTVSLPGVLVPNPSNDLVLWARNRDGTSPQATLRVRYRQPPPEPPTVTILEPARDVIVSDRYVQVTAAVRSPSEPRNFTLLRDGRPVAGARTKMQRLPDGAYLYTVDRVELEPRPNVLRVEVENSAGGRNARDGRDARTVTFAPRTITVHFDRLEEMGGQHRSFKPASHDGRQPIFEAVPVGSLWLHGSIEWPAGDLVPGLYGEPLPLRVHVNDFEQLEAVLEPYDRSRDDRQRRFRATVRLNQEECNMVRVELPPGLKTEDAECLSFSLNCDRPETGSRMHLLVIGPGRRDQEALNLSVLNALLARTENGERLQSLAALDNFTAPPDFRQGRLYSPLPDDVDAGRVRRALLRIKQIIRATPSNLNEVVVIYFEGEEMVGTDGTHFLHTKQSRASGQAEHALNCDEMRADLEEVKGAKLVLLDLQQRTARGAHSSETPAPAGVGPHVGLLRYIWLGPQDPPEELRLVKRLEQVLAQGGRVLELGKKLAEAIKNRPDIRVQWLAPKGAS